MAACGEVQEPGEDVVKGVEVVADERVSVSWGEAAPVGGEDARVGSSPAALGVDEDSVAVKDEA